MGKIGELETLHSTHPAAASKVDLRAYSARLTLFLWGKFVGGVSDGDLVEQSTRLSPPNSLVFALLAPDNLIAEG